MMLQTYLDRLRLATRGVILLRRFLPLKRVIHLRHAAEQVFDRRPAPDASLPPAEYCAEVRKLSFIALTELIGARQVLTSHRILALARAYLGHEPTIESNSFVRRLTPGPDVQALPFHQDQAVLHRPLLNVWAPLDPCGVTAPGLEVVRTYCRELLDVAGDLAELIPVERVRLEESGVLERFGAAALWHPPLAPGDALIFPGTTIHRSYVTPEMTEPRMSAELRLV